MGRAAGGMAETIRRRLDRQDEFIDTRLEPAADCARRAFYRAEARKVHFCPALDALKLADGLGLSVGATKTLLNYIHFGEAWHHIEEDAPTLRRRAVAVCDLARETAAAQAILEQLANLSAAHFPEFLQPVARAAG